MLAKHWLLAAAAHGHKDRSQLAVGSSALAPFVLVDVGSPTCQLNTAFSQSWLAPGNSISFAPAGDSMRNVFKAFTSQSLHAPVPAKPFSAGENVSELQARSFKAQQARSNRCRIVFWVSVNIDTSERQSVLHVMSPCSAASSTRQELLEAFQNDNRCAIHNRMGARQW